MRVGDPRCRRRVLVGWGLWGAGASDPREERIDFRLYFESLAGGVVEKPETGAELHNLTGAMNDMHIPSADCGESIILLYS
jgi:hypothetical protein